MIILVVLLPVRSRSLYIAVTTSLTAAALVPNMAAELLAALLRVREAPSQNVGPETVYTE
jgi:hypothetical protein